MVGHLDQAQFKTHLALIDGFNNHDVARLTEVLGTAYVAFTDAELAELANVPCVIVDRNFFQDYTYALDNMAETGVTRATSFFNPETLRNNHWLHTWRVHSTSPFAQAVVFTKDVTPAVSSVAVSPSTATVSAGQSLKLTATVVTTGFANKAVTWSVNSESATINEKGVLTVLAGTTAGTSITVTATSVFDSTKTGTATVTTA